MSRKHLPSTGCKNSLAILSQAVAAAFRSAASHGGREPVRDLDMTQGERATVLLLTATMVAVEVTFRSSMMVDAKPHPQDLLLPHMTKDLPSPIESA